MQHVEAKGFITITVRDVKTSDVIRTEKLTNVVTLVADKRLHDGEGLYETSGDRYDKIFIGNGDFPGELKTATVFDEMYARGDDISQTYNPGEPSVFEIVNRFQPPVSGTREINQILLGFYNHSIAAQVEAYAYASLATSCIQTDTEILDIFYRVEYHSDTSPLVVTPGTGVSVDAREAWRDIAASQRAGFNEDIYFYPEYATVMAHQSPTQGLYRNFARQVSGDPGPAGESNQGEKLFDIDDQPERYTKRFYKSFDLVDEVGRVMKTGTVYNMATSNKDTYQVSSWLDLFDDSFQQKPIQPIHNHSIDAVQPFLDVDALATGSGSTVITAGTYDVTDKFSKFMRVDVATEGDVGVSTYTHAVQDLGNGFEDGSFLCRQAVLPWVSGHHETTVNQTYLDDANNWKDYDDVVIVAFDGANAVGITFLDIVTGNYVTLDANSTPALPVTNIHDISVATSGDVYVACGSTGLYRIQTPYTAALVTKITTASGLPSDGEAYGVSVGYNDHLWVMVADGLCKSTDAGASWTVFDTLSVPPFNHGTFEGGVSNGNWGNTRVIIADPDDATESVILIGHVNSSNATNQRLAIAWWDTATGTITDIDSVERILQSDFGRINGNAVRCSFRGSFWVISRAVIAKSLYRLIPNTDIQALLEPGKYANPNSHARIAFFYDKDLNPYVSHHWSGHNSYHHSCLIDKRGLMCGLLNVVSAPIISFERTGGKSGLAICVNHLFDGYTYMDKFRLYQLSPDSFSFPADSRGGPHLFGHLRFDDYGWDGVNWISDYNVDAVDLSLNGFTAPRSGFIPGNKTFISSSRLDLSSAVSGATFNDDFVFAANVKTKKPHLRGEGLTVWDGADRLGIALTGVNSRFVEDETLVENHVDIASSTIYGDSDVFIDDRYVGIHDPSMVNPAKDMTKFNIMHLVPLSEATNTRLVVNSYQAVAESHPIGAADLYGTSNGGTATIDRASNHIYFSDISTSTTNIYGGTAWTNPLPHVGAKDKFRISFRRDEHAANFWPNYTFNSGGFKVRCMYDISDTTAHVSATGATIQYGIGRSVEIDNKFMSVWFKESFTDGAPHYQSYTDDGTETNSLFTTVSAFVIDDFNGVNTIAIQFNHDGNAYNTEIYRIEPSTVETLLYTYTADVAHAFTKETFSADMVYNAGRTYAGDCDVYDFAVTDEFNAPIPYTGPIAHAYLDGVKSGASAFLSQPMNFSGCDSIFVGSDPVRDADFGLIGYEGDMTNIQMWNVAWDLTDIANDAGNPDGVIVSKPAGNMICRYMNDDSVTSAETKPTHIATESLYDGTEISFVEGATTPSFVKPDFYTTGIVDGILKDNSIQFDNEFYVYTKNALTQFTDVEDTRLAPGVLTPVIPATGGQITERVTWGNQSGSINAIPGELGSSHLTTNSFGYGAINDMPSTADCELIFKIGTSSNTKGTFLAGITEINTVTSWGTALVTYSIYIDVTTGELKVHELGAFIQAFPAIVWAPGDEIKITRVGTTVAYYHNNVLFYTSLRPSTGLMWVRSSNNKGRGANYDFTWTYIRPPYCLDVGDSTLSTGKYHTNYLRVDDNPTSHVVTIDGTPCPINVPPGGFLDEYSNLPAPALGECSIMPASGLLFFNAGDAGKSVTFDGVIHYIR